LKAYVLIQAEPAADGDGLMDRLGRIPGVSGARRVSGPYDVIAEVGSDAGRFAEVVAGISAVDGVLRALVSPVVEGRERSSEDAA
jgi:hypothetical protein